MKTNTQLWENLNDWYPERIGFVNADEVEHIKKSLALDGRDIVSLRNMRDTVVMLWMIDDAYSPNREMVMQKNDRMSAVTAVIDSMIFELGGEV